ncbi:hypothetical protein [Streptomyces sp. NBC_00299]|nr:hypothetical protein [Streptomyces sp. NBC_00299]
MPARTTAVAVAGLTLLAGLGMTGTAPEAGASTNWCNSTLP